MLSDAPTWSVSRAQQPVLGLTALRLRFGEFLTKVENASTLGRLLGCPTSHSGLRAEITSTGRPQMTARIRYELNRCVCNLASKQIRCMGWTDSTNLV